MIVYPNAKVNLGLYVTEKRPDGYHNIETLFVPVPDLCDVLEVVHSDTFSVKVYNLDIEDTLCTKAYRLLADEFDLSPVAINLYKNIPVGAGLGGGSADAAFTLKALNEIFSLNLSDEILAGYAGRIGSDCPFFIYNRPMTATGRGEILDPYDLSLAGRSIKVFPQDVFVSTKEAYAGIIPRKPQIDLKTALSHPMEEWKDVLFNDFEEGIFARYPQLASVKEHLYEEGAVYAAMSGSGSSIFGIF
ncbi:MAG: 4-(cytidine 5'-diphospho)-2-C-methyl-D-erythritol kinase [Bacteroidales bacterium]|nr:4-(cytidine 5'-diphospho)-2-C-methyl-D-erythritol kinase [Candidatus Cacconaster merdequi]